MKWRSFPLCVCARLSKFTTITRPATAPEWRQKPPVQSPVQADEPAIQKMTLISMLHSTILQMVITPLLTPLMETPFLTIAVEAMPSELVRQFTLLREVDAKYSGTSKSYNSNSQTFKRESPPKSIPS